MIHGLGFHFYQFTTQATQEVASSFRGRLFSTMTDSLRGDQIMETAKDMSYSDEREAFILKVARYYYRSKQTQLAIKVAEGASYSDERDKLV